MKPLSKYEKPKDNNTKPWPVVTMESANYQSIRLFITALNNLLSQNKLEHVNKFV